MYTLLSINYQLTIFIDFI